MPKLPPTTARNGASRVRVKPYGASQVRVKPFVSRMCLSLHERSNSRPENSSSSEPVRFRITAGSMSSTST